MREYEISSKIKRVLFLFCSVYTGEKLFLILIYEKVTENLPHMLYLYIWIRGIRRENRESAMGFGLL